MPYLVAADLPTVPAGERFRALLGRPGILQLPGAHNGMAALQARAAALADDRPEVAVGVAFAGGLVVAMILKRLAR